MQVGANSVQREKAMPRTANPISRRIFTALASAGMLFLAVPEASARRVDVFANLAGTWFGGGVVTDARGQSERIRCNVSYGTNGTGLSQNLVCASPSFRFNVVAAIYNRGGSISGTWSETTRGVGGAVSGVVRGNQIITVVNGSGFTASLTIVSRGDVQSVSILPHGGDIARVSISFRR